MKVEITAEKKLIAESNGISQTVLWNRVHTRKWDVERAITEKPLDKDGIGQRAAEIRKNERANNWFSDGNVSLRCPVDGCNHVGDGITKIHCRKEHEMEREEVKKKYGMPFKVHYLSGGRKYATTENYVWQ